MILRAGVALEFNRESGVNGVAVHFIMRGVDLLTLKEIPGYSFLKRVLRYTHLAAAHKTRQVNNLSGINTKCRLRRTSPKVRRQKKTPNS